MTITLERLHQIIDELNDDYQREEDQGILQDSMEKARKALVGKEACARIKRVLGMRIEMDANAVRVLGGRKRA